MPPHFHKLGVRSALHNLKILPEDNSTILRDVGLGAAATSPFWGMIGEQRRINTPDKAPRLSLTQLERLAKAGDVVLSGGAGRYGGVLHNTTMPHSEPILGRRGGAGIGATPGEWTPAGLRTYARLYPEHATNYNRIAAEIEKNPRAIQKHQATLAERLGNMKQERVMLLRPDKGMTPQQLKAFRETGYAGVPGKWSAPRGLAATLRDWFLPKVPGINTSAPTLCKGDVCTTHTARTLEAGGKGVVPGKGAIDVLSPDFERARGLKPIGYYEGTAAKKTMSPAVRAALHYGSRGALGLGIAGSIYGLTEDPRLAAIPVAAGAAPIAARQIFGHTTFRPVHKAILAPQAKRALRLKSVGKSTLPLMLGAGALGAIPALHNYYTK